MAVIASYADLQGKILNWMARNDPDTQAELPTFVELAETRIKANIPTLEGERTALITGTGSYDYDLPALFWKARALRGTSSGGDVFPLDYVTPVQWAYELSAFEQGGFSAYKYTLRGNVDAGRKISFMPALGAGTQYYLDYVARLNPLTNNNTTNWLLSTFPNLYLSGCMIEAMDFERNGQEAARWTNKFNLILAEVETYVNEERWGGAPLVIRSE